MVPLVWSRLGDCDNVIEAFFGSGAFLLGRPSPPRVETVNDADHFVANFWRATQRDPDAVVAHADGPVNECDLHARHRWLVLSDNAAEFRRQMEADPDHFDPKVAGWWCWGLCAWIGGGWCQTPDQKKRPRAHRQNGNGEGGTLPGVPCTPTKKRPLIAGENSGSRGKGVHAQGTQRRRPMIAEPGTDSGRGVHGRPQLADAYSLGRGVHGGTAGTCEERRLWLLDWFGRLRDRLRNVRVCCGDWSRVCSSESVTTRLGVTGIFLDPPYPTKKKCGKKSRSKGLYATDADGRKSPETIRDEVLAYCLDRGRDRLMRICVAGYDTDGYADLERHGWSVFEWQAHGGYGCRTDEGKANAKRERLWFSPHCPNPAPGLFDSLAPEEDAP